MAHTTVPDYLSRPLVSSAEEIRAHAQELLDSYLGDLDRTTEPEDGAFYEGACEALVVLLHRMTA